MRSLWLLLLVVLIYLANGRIIGGADTLPARYLPFSILREFDFDLDEFTPLHDESARRHYPLWRGIPYCLRGHMVLDCSPISPRFSACIAIRFATRWIDGG